MWFGIAVIAAAATSVLLQERNLNLPPGHLKFYFLDHPHEKENCSKWEKCDLRKFVKSKRCWGYETDCITDYQYSTPKCNENSKGWSKTKAEQIETFFEQADFGYIKKRRAELSVLCTPKQEDGSSLVCAKYMRFCRARKIMLDFSSLLTIEEPMRYREDVIKPGQAGGYCNLKKKKLKSEGQHKSPLQSWFAEFEHFSELKSDPLVDNSCEIIIDKPTFIMKLDASVNMYHHFCDFLNLYATLHLNGSFSSDAYVLIWDTVPYKSNFGDTWKAFTRYPVMNIGQFKGKKVCFLDAVFPLLPRMIFGMYYNMPLIPGCSNSGLFQAFSEHIRDRLNIPFLPPSENLRVTLISRSTKYRRILNEDQLVSALKQIPGFEAQKVNFSQQLPFLDQLKISSNTDILIGIHGAGLTHMLFMPLWGAVFEIYNCDDENCYSDLARLVGVKYFTWKNSDKIFPQDEGHHPTLGAHAKFTNYNFDVEEFLSLVKEAAHYVKNNQYYLSARICKEPNCDTMSHVHGEL